MYSGEKNVIKILTLLRCGEKNNNYKEMKKEKEIEIIHKMNIYSCSSSQTELVI